MKSNSRTASNVPRRSWLATAIAALVTTSALSLAPHAQAGVRIGVSIGLAPPVLPIYEQPAIPAPGYLWTPGYWANGGDGYYWVPGTWVQPPYVGALWTPGYWGYNNNAYVFNTGYWGSHVGYYGGINYGFGYGGVGYAGGYWGHGHFWYNSSVNRFGGMHITNVYNRNVVNVTNNHFSYNGPGGVDYRATREELAYSHERHVAPVRQQIQQREMASHDQSLRASENHGMPPIMATPRAGDFAHATTRATENRGEQRQATPSREESATAMKEPSAARPKHAIERTGTARGNERVRTAAVNERTHHTQRVAEARVHRERGQQPHRSGLTRPLDRTRANANVENHAGERQQADHRQGSAHTALARRANPEHVNQAQSRQNRPKRQEARQSGAPHGHGGLEDHKPKHNGN